jgi:hypothetical protein
LADIAKPATRLARDVQPPTDVDLGDLLSRDRGRAERPKSRNTGASTENPRPPRQAAWLIATPVTCSDRDRVSR